MSNASQPFSVYVSAHFVFSVGVISNCLAVKIADKNYLAAGIPAAWQIVHKKLILVKNTDADHAVEFFDFIDDLFGRF